MKILLATKLVFRTGFLMLVSLVLARQPAWAGGVVSTLDQGHLETALIGGGVVTFAVDGTLTLTNTINIVNDTVIDGSGHSIVLSGGNQTRLFQVNSSVKFSVKSLTLANGAFYGIAGKLTPTVVPPQDGLGAGILSLGGIVVLNDCQLLNHVVKGGPGDQNPLFTTNLKQPGGNALGSALCALGGELDLTNCTLSGNFAQAGQGSSINADFKVGDGGSAWGGAIYATGAKVILQTVTLQTNVALGAETRYVISTARSGDSAGGAVYCEDSTLSVDGATVTANYAYGGNSGELISTSLGSGAGGAVFIGSRSSALIRNSLFSGNAVRTGGGFETTSGCSASGGALFVAGQLILENTILSGNSAGSQGEATVSDSRLGRGGAVCSTNSLSVSRCTFNGNVAQGGWGNNSSLPSAEGGALWSSGSIAVTNSTFASNAAVGESASTTSGAGLPGGTARGGGIWAVAGNAILVNLTIADNQASGGQSNPTTDPPGASLGAGLGCTNTTVQVMNSILAFNTGGGNVWGTIIDGGYNCSSDGSAGFVGVGSLNNTDPLLAALAANGGPTPTMALLPGSPARDKIPVGFPGTDQRGITRPQGPTADMGAFEALATIGPPSIVTQPVGQSVRAGANADFTVVASGTAPLSYQWRKDGNPIAGATTTILSLVNVQAPNGGTYSVVVSNAASSITSLDAVLTVDSTPQILVQPTSVTTPAFFTVNFNVGANGPALGYQWWHNQAPIGGANSSSLSLPNVSAGAQGSYIVVVSNFAGAVTSTVATLTFDATTLNIQVPPQSQTVVRGNPASFNVLVTGISPFTYQWHHNGSDIAGATTSTLNILSTADSDAGSYGVVVSNGYRTAASDEAQLNVTAGVPTILTQPQGRSVRAGANVDFSVVATGSGTLTYQWSKDSSPIAGATRSTLSLANVQAINSGSYTVLVSNGAGSTPSQSALLAVDSTPLILTQPSSVTTPANVPVQFSVTVDGPALGYQWWHDLNPISGANNSTLVLPNVTAGAQGNYFVVVGNFAGSVTSLVASLTFDASTLSILVPPRSQSVVSGSPASFTVLVSGVAPFNYQWHHNGIPLANGTTSTLNLPSVSDSDAGSYGVVVNNGYRTVASDEAQLTVTSGRPTIVTQPQSRTVRTGSNVDFSVVATGAAPLSYQWSFNSSPISGATSSVLSLSNVQVANSGSYSVLVSNGAGSVGSADAILTIDSSPLILVQPASTSVGGGAQVTFNVTATGPSLGYQWWHDNLRISGATASDLVLTGVGPGAQGGYFVVVTNFAGSVTSTVATLSFDSSTLSIGIPPHDLSVTRGSPATFTVSVSGISPFAYQWHHNGSSIAGATTSALNIPSTTDADAGNYNVTVSNGYRSLTSSDALLTVTVAAPTIITQPQGRTVRPGANVDFTVVASGAGTLTYLWQKDGSPIAGATTSILSLANVQTINSGAYSVVVGIVGGGSTRSQDAILLIDSRPLIVVQPNSTNVSAGAVASFNVGAVGPALNYQWWHDLAPIGGATATNLVIPSAAAGAQGNYFVVVSNSAGSVTSVVATLTFDSSTLNIVTSPQDVTVAKGNPATFSVRATGVSPFAYQWHHNGTNLAGATRSTLIIAAASANDAGAYDVTVTNAYRSVTSATAHLTVTDVALPPLLQISRNPNTVIVSFQAEAGRTYRLLSTTNFSTWSPVATNSTPTAGLLQFLRTYPKPREFYRVATP